MLKVLIVDDEPFIRKGIINKIEWNNLGIEIPEEANDAIEALEYMRKENVDIVLTDIKMPEMDGIRFIEKAKKEFGDKHRFVIISGYGEFEYARQAIKFGVTDYLLKPISEAELEETIRKIVTDITFEGKEKIYKKFLESSFSKSKDLRMDMLLSNLIDKNMDESFLKKNLITASIDFPYNNYIVLLLKIDLIEYHNSSFCDSDKDLILFAVRNILEHIFLTCPLSFIFMNIKNEREYVIINNSNAVTNKDLIKRLSQEAIASIYKYLKVKSTIGIGKFCYGLSEIHKSYSQASFAIREKILKGNGRVYDIEEINQISTGIELLDNDYKKLFLSYLQDGRKEDIVKLMENLFDKKLSSKFFYNHSSVYELCMEFYIFLSRYLKQNNKDINEFLGEKYEFIDTIMDLGSLEEVSSWLKKTCSTTIDYVLKDRKLTGEEIVQEVKAYINRNYSEDISLSFIAHKYFIHPNYFCRIFRSIIGESFTEYITSVRIKKAKDFLLDSKLRLNKVCELVGYDDPRYFSQVFKKYTGVSPSEYQANNATIGD